MDSEGPSGGGRRLLVGGAVAVLTLVLVGLALGAREEPPLRVEHLFPGDYIGPVWLTVSTDDGDPRTVVVEWGRLRTTFVHESAEPLTYFFDRGGLDGRKGPLLVDVSPPADVTFGYGVPDPEAVNIGDTPWDVLPVNEGTTPARPANADDPYATASVNEWVSYGLEVFGVGVRPAPDYATEKMTVVTHGETYRARCWVRGQEVTNGNYADPSDDGAQYTSDVWYEIETPEGWGFIPDAFFARRAETDHLNLPECETPPARP